MTVLTKLFQFTLQSTMPIHKKFVNKYNHSNIRFLTFVVSLNAGASPNYDIKLSEENGQGYHTG